MCSLLFSCSIIRIFNTISFKLCSKISRIGLIGIVYLLFSNEYHTQVEFLDLDEGDDARLECTAVGMKPITYEWRTRKHRISAKKTAELRSELRLYI